MKCLSHIVFISSIVLCSCNQNPKSETPIVETGGIDSAAIAEDTAMQKSIDNSYEFATTVTISPTLVYDIRAFGGTASKGAFAIIKRGADNKPDTVEQGERQGKIVNAFAADLNNDKLTEIYMVTQSVDSGSFEDVIAYQFDETGLAKQLVVPKVTSEEIAAGYMGRDSIYIENNFLIRQFPAYKKNDAPCCPSGGSEKVYYQFKKNIFVKQKQVKS